MLLPSWSFFCRKDTFLMTAILVFSSPSLVPLLAAFISCWTWAGEAEERMCFRTARRSAPAALEELWRSVELSSSPMSRLQLPESKLRPQSEALSSTSEPRLHQPQRGGGAEHGRSNQRSPQSHSNQRSPHSHSNQRSPTPAGGEAAAGRSGTHVHGRKSEEQVQPLTRLMNVS